MIKNSKLPVVGILGTNGTISMAPGAAGDALHRVGWNTGNLIYQYAADRNLRGPRLHFTLEAGPDLSEIRRSIDILHIPAANQLNPHVDLTALVDTIEFLDKPVFIAGLGMQCELSDDEMVLNPDALRFIDSLKKLAAGIGVRGEATRRLLARHGVVDVAVTGCPSNFINRTISGSSIQSQLSRVRALPGPRLDFFPGTLSNHRHIEAKLRTLTAGCDRRMVLQTNPALFNFVGGQHDDREALSYLAWERGEIAPGQSQEEFNASYANAATFYYSAPAWIDSVARRDLGIGMRMHGVVATIQGGAAGVCVVSDGRIKELVEAMGYPKVSLEDVAQASTLNDVLDRVSFDAAGFDEKRRAAFSAYSRLARETGLVLDESTLGERS